jgi:U3 small nucleolar RNA-associated protein 12
MASGSADTYIVIYDLIADTACFKLLGHNEQITNLASFINLNPIRGNEETLLISSSKDGLLKIWDLEQQTCLVNSSD